MSDGRHQAFAAAERVPVWTRPAARRFTAPPAGVPGGFAAWADAPAEPEPTAGSEPAAPVIAAEALHAQGYAEGLAAGRAQAEAALAEEYAGLHRLAESLDALRPEPPQALAASLAAAVRRLVTQIVGEVEIAPETLEARALAVAATIAEDSAPARLRLHPVDAARLTGAELPVQLCSDPLLAPGTILLETGAGWVEDGPHVRLERLRAALDRMGVAR